MVEERLKKKGRRLTQRVHDKPRRSQCPRTTKPGIKPFRHPPGASFSSHEITAGSFLSFFHYNQTLRPLLGAAAAEVDCFDVVPCHRANLFKTT